MRFSSKIFLAAAMGTSSLAAPAMAQQLPPGFDSMFDGVSLQGWQGDPAVWSVQDGTITASTEGPRSGSTFLIYDKKYKNFEIRFKYRFVKDGGNSGLQFRSGLVGDNFEMAGPQANIIAHPADCAHPRCTQERFGMLSEEGNRGELVMFGQQGTVTRERREGGGGLQIVRTVTGLTNPPADIVAAINRQGEWNEVVTIAYEGRILHIFNNVVVFDAYDKDALAPTEGLIGLQANADRAIEFQFKDLAIKSLDSFPEIAGRFIYDARPLAVPDVSYKSVQFSAVNEQASAGQ